MSSWKEPLLWRNSCSEKILLRKSGYFKEVWRSSFSKNKAILKKSQYMREEKLSFEKKVPY